MDNNKIKVLYVVISVIFVIILMLVGTFLFQAFLEHEINQRDCLSVLEARIGLVEEKLKLLEEPANEISWGGYNYLAIGNSITTHPVADYWWNECGMAASIPENDYYHIVLDWLKGTHSDVNSNAFNFAIWETLYTDRAETLEVLDCYLDESLDLITVQLGENVSNMDTFDSDFAYLLDYIKNSAPQAQVLVIGDVWENGDRDKIKEKIAEKCGVGYISLNEIKDNREYQCGLGTIVYGEDGETHIVEHEGVAAHPNDKAMRYIAEKIIEYI